MAIMRGGVRIFGQDIRLGIPRDKSLVNVAGDRRLKRRPGGNSETTIGRFIAQMNQGEGFARPTRYLVVIHPPQGDKIKNTYQKNPHADEFDMTPGRNDLESGEMKRNVGMMCNKVTLPSRDVNTTKHITYGPGREMPYAYSFPGNIECTFYGDKFLRQRMFFENWQKKIFDIETHNMNWYEDYVGTMDIYQLGSFAAEQDRDRVTYAVRLYEVYPQTIGSMEMSYGATDSIHSIPITLNFRTWKNLTIDQVNGMSVGSAFGPMPTIKPSGEFGLFGGILSRLPPEIQRIGRDVLNTVRRNMPIGRVTGGRVFPPFT